MNFNLFCHYLHIKHHAQCIRACACDHLNNMKTEVSLHNDKAQNQQPCDVKLCYKIPMSHSKRQEKFKGHHRSTGGGGSPALRVIVWTTIWSFYLVVFMSVQRCLHSACMSTPSCSNAQTNAVLVDWTVPIFSCHPFLTSKTIWWCDIWKSSWTCPARFPRKYVCLNLLKPPNNKQWIRWNQRRNCAYFNIFWNAALSSPVYAFSPSPLLNHSVKP